MKKSEDSQDEAENPWETMHERLVSELKASGLTVTEQEPSDDTRFTVTFPQGTRPGSNKLPRKAKALTPAIDVPPVSICGEWGYELHTVAMPAARWAEIKDGAESVAESKGWYEGTSFDITRQFNFGQPGALVVSYGEDGADGFIGSVGDAVVAETDAT